MRRAAGHLAAVILVGLFLRILLFDQVGIWGDFGFYSYDTRLILQGETPFVDFLGRSPAFLYALAAARAVVGHPVRLLRWFIITWWILTALPVYAIARHLNSHRAGLVAVAFFLWTPFSLAYHMWANTQSLALFFATTAIALLVYRLEDWRAYPAAGTLLGVAFLARRSVVVLLPAIGVYLLLDGYRNDWNTSRILAATTGRSSLLGSAFLATLLAGYAAVVQFDPNQTWALFITHAVNLVATVGRGGFPLLGVTDVPPVTTQLDDGRIPVFNDLCQLCGLWTARTFAKTILVSAPVVAPLLLYFRDWQTNLYSERQFHYFAGSLIALGVWGTVRVIIAGHYLRVATIVAFFGIGLAAFHTDRLDRRHLYGGGIALILSVLLFLSAGYLYRNRFLHTYYFADFMPFICIIAGICTVVIWEHTTDRWRIFLSVALLITMVTSFYAAHPITVVFLNDNTAGWFTTDNIQDYQHDLEQRVDDDRVIWTGHPTYVAGTDVRLVRDTSRGHYLGATFSDEGPAADYYTVVNDGLRSGYIQYVILDRMTWRLSRWNATAKRLVEQNYCKVVDADPLYDRTNATLYRYQPDCPAGLHPNITAKFTH